MNDRRPLVDGYHHRVRFAALEKTVLLARIQLLEERIGLILGPVLPWDGWIGDDEAVHEGADVLSARLLLLLLGCLNRSADQERHQLGIGRL